jgi:nucleotide-binding universal stress UspA family protein
MIKKILVAVDGSESANRAARFAAELAKEMNGSVELLHVYDAPTAAQLGLRSMTREEIQEMSEHIAQGSVEAAEKAMGNIAPVTHHVSFGHPAQEVVQRAKDIDASLIVLGSRGLRAVEGVLLGSVSYRVLQRADRPVTIVH